MKYKIGSQVAIRNKKQTICIGIVLSYDDGKNDKLGSPVHEDICIKTAEWPLGIKFRRSCLMDVSYYGDWYPKSNKLRAEWGLISITPIYLLV